MILSTSAEFKGSKRVLNLPGIAINNLDYKSNLNVNKVRIGPLIKMPGNQDKKSGEDIVYFCIGGIGSVEVHDKKAPIRAGDIFILKANEPYAIINDSMDASIDLISVF